MDYKGKFLEDKFVSNILSSRKMVTILIFVVIEIVLT